MPLVGRLLNSEVSESCSGGQKKGLDKLNSVDERTKRQ